MQRLFLFLYQYRAFLTFILLEILCTWLIVQNNRHQGAKFFNSSNRLSANLLSTSQSVTDYFNLTDVNKDLAEENAELKRKIQQLQQSIYRLDVREIKDAEIINKFDFISAKVINNSTRRFNNYITVNRGSEVGIEPGMAVVSTQGVVGKVKAVSNHFAVINSILHSDVMISSKIKRTGDLCTTKWGGKDPYVANLLYVPLHIQINEGDSIVTSGFNAIFPENVPVGVVKSVTKREDALFYDIEINLATDLNELSYVYLIKNNLKIEQDSLQNLVIEE